MVNDRGFRTMNVAVGHSRALGLIAAVALMLITGCGNAQKDGLAADPVSAKASKESPFYKHRLTGNVTASQRAAFADHLAKAKSGDVQSQVEVGLYHYNDRKRDLAREWFLKAAAAGSHAGQYYVALLSRGDDQVTELRKAADMGNPEAQYEVSGRVARTDPESGARYLLMAAEGNYPLAQEAVARRLDGTERFRQPATDAIQRDEARALYWYKRLSENPYADGVEGNGPWRRRAHALTGIGLLYFHGRGAPQDDRLAAEFLEKGIAGGSTSHSAYIALAELYQQGRGVTKNVQKAEDLIKRAPRPRPQR